MDYIYIISVIGYFLPKFTIQEATTLLICNLLILNYINKNLKIFFNDNKITLFGEIDRPNGNKYGMPSGHSQLATFTFLFIYSKYKKLDNLFLIIYLSILLQRIVSNKHTVNQVIVGAIFGILTFIIFKLFENFFV